MASELEVLKEWLNSRFDKIDTRLEKIDARIDKVEARLDTIEMRLDKVENSVLRLESRVGGAEKQIEYLRERLERSETALLTGFHNWSRTVDLRLQAIPQLDARLASPEHRVSALQMPKPPE